jgi:DDE superfamily endonuclease
LEDDDMASLASAKNRWSNYEFSLNYLKNIFDPFIHAKAGGQRLLIVDGHSSHVNREFLETCDRLQILVAILPPLTTHQIHPLDMSLFQPLATAYSRGLDNLMHKEESFVSIIK